MRPLGLIVFMSLVGSTAMAQYTYDYKTGNSYTKVGNTTFGSNSQTGSSWSTTTNGSQSYGTDSKGNSWNYNSTTGSYNNSSGKTCYGKGAYRTCN